MRLKHLVAIGALAGAVCGAGPAIADSLPANSYVGTVCIAPDCPATLDVTTLGTASAGSITGARYATETMAITPSPNESVYVQSTSAGAHAHAFEEIWFSVAPLPG